VENIVMRISMYSASSIRKVAMILVLLVGVPLFTGGVNGRLVTAQPVAAYQFVGEGQITSISGTVWTINGLTVTVIDQTAISGSPVVGSFVSISGIVLSGNIWLAQSISVIAPTDPIFRFTGPIEQKGPNVWRIGSVTLIVLAGTSLIGNLELGALAEVTFQALSDGSLLALVIEGQAGETPTLTATTTRSPTMTPSPTSTITPPIVINCYQITFLGVVYNPNNTSTWSYLVTELPCAQDLSNWLLSLPTCTQPTAATPEPWEYVNPDPNFQLPGIKWQVGNGFTQGVFSVTLVGHWAIGITQVGVKGPDVGIGVIAGPSCQLTTPTPIATSSYTPTSTLMPTIFPVATATPTVPPPPPTSTPLPPTSTPVPPPPPTPVPPSPPPANIGPIVITDNDQTLTFTCSGNEVIIRGNANNITLLGNCGAITIRGNGNRVSIQSATSVTNTGNGNQIVG
jgi:hypothetical protein